MGVFLCDLLVPCGWLNFVQVRMVTRAIYNIFSSFRFLFRSFEDVVRHPAHIGKCAYDRKTSWMSSGASKIQEI